MICNVIGLFAGHVGNDVARDESTWNMIYHFPTLTKKYGSIIVAVDTSLQNLLFTDKGKWPYKKPNILFRVDPFQII